MRIVVLGLSITSSWGNGHATNYRALAAALTARGHDWLFLERDMPWYASSRDLPQPPWGRTVLYGSLAELRAREEEVREADLVVVGSYVPEGVAVAEWALATARGAVAFYDIDTPVTLAKLARGDEEYLAPGLVPRFDLYLSFTGGPTLERLERDWGARRARAFHCLVDPALYAPRATEQRWALGYLGTYSEDRQPAVERLLLEPSRRLVHERFVVGGPQYPREIDWPANVQRVEHVPPADHAALYGAQAFTLSVTRRDMLEAGWSPSVRLFEAAACGVPVITDRWPGLEEFFEPGREIFVADGPDDVVRLLRGVDAAERATVGARARRRVLAEHTAVRRAEQLVREVAALHGAVAA
jgi:spore maturation protein CgeB